MVSCAIYLFNIPLEKSAHPYGSQIVYIRIIRRSGHRPPGETSKSGRRPSSSSVARFCFLTVSYLDNTKNPWNYFAAIGIPHPAMTLYLNNCAAELAPRMTSTLQLPCPRTRSSDTAWSRIFLFWGSTCFCCKVMYSSRIQRGWEHCGKTEGMHVSQVIS